MPLSCRSCEEKRPLESRVISKSCGMGFISCVMTLMLFLVVDDFLQYLTLESSFEGKDYVCDRLLQFLLTEASSGVSDKLSFQLMEALLHRIHLNLFTGRMESALALLQVRQQRNDVTVGVLSALRACYIWDLENSSS